MTAPEIDVEDLVISYIDSLTVVAIGQVAGRMPANISPPFILVQRVAGGDDFIVDHATVSVHCFATDQTAASDIARDVHHAMRKLTMKTAVTMPDGSTASPYGPTRTQQTPIFMPWEPDGGGGVLSRYVARYRIDIRLPSISKF